MIALLRRLRTDKDLQEWLILGGALVVVTGMARAGWLA